MIAYPAVARREGRFVTMEFPDCPGCQTFVEHPSDPLPAAGEALQGWLETVLAEGEAPPRPTRRFRPPRGCRAIAVSVAPRLGLTLAIRWARQDAGLSQAALARQLGVSQQAVAKVEHPDANPTLDTLLRVAAALGMSLSLSRESSRPPRSAGAS